MNSPINRIIELTQSRDAAKLKSNGDKSKPLNLKVVELVASANKMALPERHVIPRNALVVMARAMNELSSLPDESREAGVLREVTKFISLSQNTVGSKDRYVKHTDLLPAGHPLSDRNSSLSLDDFLEKYSTWISADPGISDDARQLVAAAYSQIPYTLEREHAFMRLRALSASSVPSYIKLDGASALVAAFNFGDGNSSAARRARVALQWRDRFGRWVEMGRGINFKFRLPDGGVGTASGTYVGSDSNAGYRGNWARKEANAGYVEVKGNENVPDGIYSIRNNNAEVFKARLSEAELERAGVDSDRSSKYKMSSQFDESIPDLDDLLATKVDAPSGWTKNDDGSFTSDDDYKVIPNEDGYSVHRLDPEGNTGDKVGDAKTWADAQNIAADDEDAYDKYKEDVESGQLPFDDGTRPEPRYSRMNREVQAEIKQLKDQIPQNQESNNNIEKQLERALSGKDSRGRDLPDGWYTQIDPNRIDETYYKDIPGATRSDEYLVATVDREDGSILYGSGGEWFNTGEKVDSWDKVTADSPKVIDELNRGRRALRLEPIGTPSPDEPPSPTEGDGGSRPKSPAPSSPAAPALFKEFDVPAGAFQLRTVDYEPDGRVDEESTNFTDDPSALATRYPLDTLIRAFTQSLIGEVDENVIDEIVDINDDGDGNIPDLSEVQDALEQRAPQVDIGRASGAGSLEFNAGSEFVPAEALYNAVWLAGGDPNRVIANAYDSANGNRENLNKLIQAQGGIPSPEDEKLIVDMQDEIKSIEDVTPDDEEIVANANDADESNDLGLAGGLIENIPVEFTNPDYYDYYNMDLAPYVPSELEVDENGASDNPKLIAILVESADLIQQLQIGIKDGTGSALIRFGDDATSIVPVEAIRDALQYQGINTNDILFKIRDESREENVESPTLQRDSQRIKDLIAQAGGSVDDETANKIREAIDQEGLVDWSEAVDREIIDAITEVAGPSILEPAPAEPVAPQASETPAAPVANYPGPRQPGYTAENTTLDVDGNVISSGTRIIATRDGKQGRVVRIQNDPEYARIVFDDGTIAVRSASKIRVIASADGSAPVAAPEGSLPVAPTPATDVSERLDRPTVIAPRIARAGDTVGVNDADSKIPDAISNLTQNDVAQTKFTEWGARDAEIAKAANNRVSLDELEKAMREVAAAKEERDREKLKAAQDRLNVIAADIYGSREGLSFGAEFYTLRLSVAQAYGYGTAEEIRSGSKKVEMEISFDVVAQSGNVVGGVRRGISMGTLIAADGTRTKTISASNNYMKVSGSNKKKGFASAYNRYMENWYIANDIKKVNVFAAGGREYQGGFVWALNGFGWSSDRGSDIKEIINKISRNAKNADEKAVATRLLKKLSDSYNKETNRYDLSKAPTPMELALVGWYPGASDWVGKSVMTQTSWNGTKNLLPASREQVQAVNYNQIKNAERRIQAGQNKPGVSSELLAYISTNDFQTSNPGLSAYIDQIRAALRNNDPLGTLSPDAKVALSKYVSAEMINKDSKVPVEDTFKLRNALNAEYRADYAYSNPFEVGTELLQFTLNDFENDSAKIENAGYSYRELLRGSESGMNHTWEVTHVASGQVFYVKNEKLSRDWNNERGVAVETEMSILMNAMGMNGRYEVRASEVEDDFIVMSRAGANLPLSVEPINASGMLQYGLPSPDGERYYGDDAKTFVKNLKNPEDLIRMSILDMLGNNKDRHDGNWMVAFDSTDNKLVIFPIDNALSSISESNEDAQQQMYNFLATEWSEDIGDVYRKNMPGLISLAGKDRAYSIYANEVKKIIDNIDNELVKPRGNELAALIDKWGTYDAFRDAMRGRLENLITNGTELNKELRLSLGLGYWG
jgi:hypothetical protein